MSAPIKLLIVDDSAVVRQVLSNIFASDPGLCVLATAADPLIAQERMAAAWPDVIAPCRKNSPLPSPAGSTSCAPSRCARRATATA